MNKRLNIIIGLLLTLGTMSLPPEVRPTLSTRQRGVNGLWLTAGDLQVGAFKQWFHGHSIAVWTGGKYKADWAIAADIDDDMYTVQTPWTYTNYMRARGWYNHWYTDE